MAEQETIQAPEEPQEIQELKKKYDYTDPDMTSHELAGVDRKKPEDEKPPESEEVDEADQEEPESDASEEEQDDLVEQAVLLGFTRDEAEGFSNEKDLRHAMRIAQAAAPPEEHAGDQKEQQSEAPEPWEEFKAPEVGLSADDHDEDVVKAFEKLNDAYSSELKKVRQYMSMMANTVIQSEQREQVRWFDDRISSLPPELEKRVGSGPSSALDQRGSQFAARQNLINTMYGLMEKRNLTRDQAFDMAVRAEFGSGGKRRRKRSAIARPSRSVANRKGAESDQEALASLKERYKGYLRENGDF